MELFLFCVFAGLMLTFAVGVVIMRDPVSSAACLIGTFIGLAALFMCLDAFFIGIIQILVYAGAVMVLFLFIIMLLDLKAGTRRKIHGIVWCGSGLVLAGFLTLLFKVIYTDFSFSISKPVLAATNHNDVVALGMTLFSKFNLPFQIIGVLLLVATIGVVLLSNRELK